MPLRGTRRLTLTTRGPSGQPEAVAGCRTLRCRQGPEPFEVDPGRDLTTGGIHGPRRAGPEGPGHLRRRVAAGGDGQHAVARRPGRGGWRATGSRPGTATSAPWRTTA